MDPGQVGAALKAACLVELDALKPGNVHRYASGHAMSVADFEASARAVAEVFARPGLTVGARILDSVRRTREAVGCNTNLGIVLLCAPLAEAALQDRGADLQARLAEVLDRLDVNDADLTFQAITLAAPGGLGSSADHDVHAPATVGLQAAMAAAKDRDRIARQYVTAYKDVFGLGLPRLREGLSRWSDEAWAATAAYFGFLGRFPDTHIVRKYGPETAEAVCREALSMDDQLLAAVDPAEMREVLLAFDVVLKDRELNPGTSADLTVASLFARRLQDAIGDNSSAH